MHSSGARRRLTPLTNCVDNLERMNQAVGKSPSMNATTFLENRLQRRQSKVSTREPCVSCKRRSSPPAFSSPPLATTSFPSFASLESSQHAWTSNEWGNLLFLGPSVRIQRKDFHFSFFFFFFFPLAWWIIKFAKDAGCWENKQSHNFSGAFSKLLCSLPVLSRNASLS